MLPLADDVEQVAETYWAALNADNRVSLLARLIDARTGRARLSIVNKHS